MAAWWVRIDLLQNYFAIRNVCLRRWQIILTGFSAESYIMSDPIRLIFLALLIAACGAPVTVERVHPRVVHRELTANVLTVGEESDASRIVLDRWDLTERFQSDPEGTLAQLHAAVVGER